MTVTSFSPDDELLALRNQLAEALNRVDNMISGRAAERIPSERDVLSLPRTEAIEWALQVNRRPMSPVEVWKSLREQGRDDPKMEVQVTTYDLWRRGRLVKLRRGIYCHPDHIPPGGQPMTWEE
jgi:hypothetical protein